MDNHVISSFTSHIALFKLVLLLKLTYVGDGILWDLVPPAVSECNTTEEEDSLIDHTTYDMVQLVLRS